MIKSDNCEISGDKETPVYERPWTYDEIKQHYGKFVADNLSKDPCHKWRMETGIELIHKEPDLDEQKRIWKNWQLMSDEDKQISDEKCIELFGMTNSRLHEFIMKNNWNNPKYLRSKFNQIYEQVMTKCENKYNLVEVYRPLLPKNYPFNNFINHLLLEDYHIFPVPKDLLNDIENFVITNNTFAEKQYTISDILNLTINWEYYAEFKENLELMLKQNINCKIVCCVFNTEFDVLKIFEKYRPINTPINNIFNLKAYVYSYDENGGSADDENSDFNICLCINKHINKQKIKKVVQHELIHWMQVTLNSETHKTFGLFNNKSFNLTSEQIEILSDAIKLSETELKQNFEYLLSGREFEAWVANTVEEFENSGLTIDEFNKTIENKNLFKNTVNSVDTDKQEMYIFGEICYFSSLNDKTDDRYWYLLEAMKNNNV